MRLEGNVKVDRCVGRRVTNALPVGRDGIPRVLHLYIVPKWGKRREVAETRGGEDDEHREPVIVHGHRGSLTVKKARGPENQD